MINYKSKPKKAFAAPWHAEIFALTVYLTEKGHFCWAEWANRFGKNLEVAGKSNKAGSVGKRGLDDSDCYYQIWLQTFIEIMQEKEVVDMNLFLIS